MARYDTMAILNKVVWKALARATGMSPEVATLIATQAFSRQYLDRPEAHEVLQGMTAAFAKNDPNLWIHFCEVLEAANLEPLLGTITTPTLILSGDSDMMTPVVASFLRAAVRARCSIVVAGAQGAGKTTLVRALCAEIDELEAIGTFETEYELHLHELGRHKVVIPWEARPGSGERGADGRQSGEFTLDEALVDSFRFNLSRQIVGEVRGGEAFDLLQALNTGHAGSLSTIHANSAEQALARLASCVVQSGVELPYQAVRYQIADAIDLVLHLVRRPGTRVVEKLIRVGQYDAACDRYHTGVVGSRGGDGAPAERALP